MTAMAHSEPAPPFKRGGDNVLVEALNERQRQRDAERMSQGDTEAAPQAISSAEVLEVLEEIGMAEGFDRTATHLFFGAEGLEGYTEGGEDFAVETHGGFVFADPDHGGIYTITATRSTGTSVPERRPGRSLTGHTPPGSTDNDNSLVEVVGGFFRDKLSPSDRGNSSYAGNAGLQWRVSASALCCEVQPRFYEDIWFLDLIPFADDVEDPQEAGLVSLYPLQTSKKIDIHTGAIRTPSADEALRLADSLGAVMAENGVLCDPRVVLMETQHLPLLPRQARAEHLHERQDRQCRDESDDQEQRPMHQSVLGAAGTLGTEHDYGHRVRTERGSIVPDQQTAGWLATRASEYAAWEERVRDLEGRITDPNIPERRKHSLRPRLQSAASARDEAWAALQGQTEDLVGLLLSVLAERPELVQEAHRRKLRL